MPISPKISLLGVGLASIIAATSSFPLNSFTFTPALPSLLMAQASTASSDVSNTPASTYFEPTFQLTSAAASAIVAACEGTIAHTSFRLILEFRVVQLLGCTLVV